MTSVLHKSQDIKLFDHKARGQPTQADQFQESVDDAMCQNMC